MSPVDNEYWLKLRTEHRAGTIRLLDVLNHFIDRRQLRDFQLCFPSLFDARSLLLIRHDQKAHVYVVDVEQESWIFVAFEEEQEERQQYARQWRLWAVKRLDDFWMYGRTFYEFVADRECTSSSSSGTSHDSKESVDDPCRSALKEADSGSG